MADQWTKNNIGDCVMGPKDGQPLWTYEAIVVTSAVTVGMIVDLTHVATDLPKVSPAADSSLVAGGVVMAFLYGGTGQVGERVLVGKGGLFCVKAGSPGTTAGKKIAANRLAGNGTYGGVGDSTTASQVIGRAWQTAASGEKMLAWID